MPALLLQNESGLQIKNLAGTEPSPLLPEESGHLQAADPRSGYSPSKSSYNMSLQNPDLLEEALESPGSGVNCVGKSHRHFSDGNRGLANVGEMVMKLVLTDQCYLFKVPDGKPPVERVQMRSL